MGREMHLAHVKQVPVSQSALSSLCPLKHFFHDDNWFLVNYLAVSIEKCIFAAQIIIEKCSFCLTKVIEKCKLSCYTEKAQELRAHGHKLFYYDQRKLGEVDYLIDNHKLMSAHPVEVKSGKDYTVHSALNNLLNNPDYNIPTATVFSNEREIYEDGRGTYMPVYLVMFIKADNPQVDDTEYLFWYILQHQIFSNCFSKNRLFLVVLQI